MLKKTVPMLAMLLLLVGSTSIAHAQEWSEQRIQEMYLEFLQENGMEGTVDGDGDVQFSYNDHTYFVEVNENDPEFFRVVLFNIWPIESVEEALQVNNACNEVNRAMKCTKAYVINDNVWLAVELFVGSPDAFKPVFMRSLRVIEDGVETFVENM